MTNPVTAEPTALLYVLWAYPLLSQTFIRNEIHGLRDLGVDVHVLSIEPADPVNIELDWPGDFRLLKRPGLGRALADHAWFAVRRPSHYRKYLVAVGRLREHWQIALRRLPTEARRLCSHKAMRGCHTHFAWPSASVALYLARLLDLPPSITVHAHDLYVGNKRSLRMRLRQFARVVTVCNFNVGLLTGVGVTHAGDGDVQVVPCGVAIPKESNSDRQSPGTELVSVGRLVEKKGFDTLIQAMALVREQLPDVRATIVGEGPERADLTRLISALGLEQNVILAGAMSHKATLEIIGGANLFCLASQMGVDGDCDAVPVVIREAMAQGIPVIATRVAGIPETVDDEVGWLVDPRSPRQLAEAITVALHDTPERHRRGSAGRARVLRRWTLETQAMGMLRVFDRDGQATNTTRP